MSFDAGSVISRLELGIEGWKKSVETVKKDQQSLAGFATRHADEIQKLGRTFTVAGGAIVAALGAAVKVTADYGDKINDLSQRTGVATEILSGYKLAADNSGTSLEGLATGLKILSRNMFDATTGTGSARDAFDFLKISVENADGTLRSSNDVMLDVAARFKDMDDGAQKTALSMDIFGKSGSDLIPMLNLGKQGLKDNYEAAERFGGVISKEAAQACDDFNDELGNMKMALGGATREIGTALMPVVKDMIEKVTSVAVKVREWTSAHPELTKTLMLAAGAAGGLMLVVGPMLIALPKLIEGWHLLRGAIHGFNPIAAAGATAIGILVVKLFEYYDILQKTVGAINYESEAADRLTMKQTDLENKMYELVTTGKMTVDQFYKLKDQFLENGQVTDDYALKMWKWVRSGKAGKDAAEGLRDIGKKHEEQNKKTTDSLAGSGGLIPAVKTTTKEVDYAAMVTETWKNRFIDLKSEVMKVSQTLTETALPAARDFNDEIEAMLPASAKGRIEQDVKDISHFWDGFFNDVTQGWSDTIGDFIKGNTSIVTAWNRLWKDMGDTIIDFISKIIVEKLIKALEGIFTTTKKSTDEAGGAFTSMGTTIANVATSVGSVITTLVGAIVGCVELIAKTVVDIVAYAIETLAESIAAAAKALAAAAPELIIVGAIALALYAGFKAIGALIGSGGGGSGDGMGRVVERQDRFLAMFDSWHTDMLDIAVYCQGRFDVMIDRLDWIGNLVAGQVTDAINSVAGAIEGIPGAATGAMVMGPAFVRVGENAPRVPEVILPLPELGAFARQMESSGTGTRAGMGGGGGAVTVNLNGPLIHTTGVSRADLERAGETLVDILRFQLSRGVKVG